MTNRWTNLVNFFRVSPVQQMTAWCISAPVTAWSVYNAMRSFSEGKTRTGIACATLASIHLGLLCYNEYFAVRRMREYDKVKKALEEHGWDERIIESKSHSWCQRNMVQVASDDSNYGKETKEYLHRKGYRRYNLLQD